MGLGLDFTLQSDGSIEGAFAGGKVYEGYPGLLHGGVVAALLDGTMTNCLFAKGKQAVTAELHVRYRHPVALQSQVTVRAWVVRARPPLQLLAAELRQDNLVKVTASAKFMESPPQPAAIPEADNQ